MTPDEIQALAHAEVARVLTELADACYLSDTDLMPEAFIAKCDRYGVELHTHCGNCHGIDGAHEQFCPDGLCRICERPGCPGDCADRAWDAWREERLADDGVLWEGEE